MQSGFDNPDERLNALVTEIAGLTGENYVVAMCRALEERRDRLVSRGTGRPVGGTVRITLEAEILDEMLHLLPEEEGHDDDGDGDDPATLR